MTNGKVNIEDIVQIGKHDELINSAKKIAELSDEKFSLLISFLEQNKESLLEKIDITKYLDDTHKIKEGMEEEYNKARFPESLKFCEEKKMEYFEDEGIFLGNYTLGMPSESRSFFGHRSSYSREENEIFYIPTVTQRDFLEVTKNHSSRDMGISRIHITETLDYRLVGKKDVMPKIDIIKLTKKLRDFLILNEGYKDFSSFYKKIDFHIRSTFKNII